MSWIDLSLFQDKLKEAAKLVGDLSLDNLQDEDLRRLRLQEEKEREEKLKSQPQTSGIEAVFENVVHVTSDSLFEVKHVLQDTFKQASRFVDDLNLEDTPEPFAKTMGSSPQPSGLEDTTSKTLANNSNNKSDVKLESTSQRSTTTQVDKCMDRDTPIFSDRHAFREITTLTDVDKDSRSISKKAPTSSEKGNSKDSGAQSLSLGLGISQGLGLGLGSTPSYGMANPSNIAAAMSDLSSSLTGLISIATSTSSTQKVTDERKDLAPTASKDIASDAHFEDQQSTSEHALHRTTVREVKKNEKEAQRLTFEAEIEELQLDAIDSCVDMKLNLDLDMDTFEDISEEDARMLREIAAEFADEIERERVQDAVEDKDKADLEFVECVVVDNDSSSIPPASDSYQGEVTPSPLLTTQLQSHSQPQVMSRTTSSAPAIDSAPLVAEPGAVYESSFNIHLMPTKNLANEAGSSDNASLTSSRTSTATEASSSLARMPVSLSSSAKDFALLTNQNVTIDSLKPIASIGTATTSLNSSSVSASANAANIASPSITMDTPSIASTSISVTDKSLEKLNVLTNNPDSDQRMNNSREHDKSSITERHRPFVVSAKALPDGAKLLREVAAKKAKEAQEATTITAATESLQSASQDSSEVESLSRHNPASELVQSKADVAHKQANSSLSIAQEVTAASTGIDSFSARGAMIKDSIGRNISDTVAASLALGQLGRTVSQHMPQNIIAGFAAATSKVSSMAAVAGAGWDARARASQGPITSI